MVGCGIWMMIPWMALVVVGAVMFGLGIWVQLTEERASGWGIVARLFEKRTATLAQPDSWLTEALGGSRTAAGVA